MYLFCLDNFLRKSFREKVLMNNFLDFSILLPLKSISNKKIQYSLIILNKERVNNDDNNIKFIDASHYYDSNFLLKCNSDNDITENFSKAICDKYPSSIIDFRDIIIKNQKITADFHCINPIIKNISDNDHRKLSEYASIYKSPVFLNNYKSNLKTITLRNLSPKEFSQYGYTLPFNGEYKCYSSEIIKEEQKLKPNDILFVYQRNIGKICIIDPDFSECMWTGSNFTFICRSNNNIDPRVLYMYLASDTVKYYLLDRSSKSSLPSINLSVFKNLPVPIFSEEIKNTMIESFIKLDKIKCSISHLNKKAYDIMHHFYNFHIH